MTVTAARPADWLQAARPRTLGVAVSAVSVGIGVAWSTGRVVAWHAACAFVVAVAIQIGTNFANDYADGVRGADSNRVGPTRLVASGLAKPATVRAVAVGAFAVAGSVGLALALVVQPWLLAIGACSIAAGWLYTGGPRPYGYVGLGEVFVFCFFGLVTVVGTTFVASGRAPALAYLAAVPVGLVSVGLLVVNNLRDRRSDAEAGKRTLAVRLGERRTRLLYAAVIGLACVLPAAVAPWRPYALLGLVAAPLAVVPVRRVLGGVDRAGLIAVLALTGLVQLVFGLLFAVGIAL